MVRGYPTHDKKFFSSERTRTTPGVNKNHFSKRNLEFDLHGLPNRADFVSVSLELANKIVCHRARAADFAAVRLCDI